MQCSSPAQRVTKIGCYLIMMRFLVIYPVPTDPELFDRHYSEIHVPIVKRFTKLRKYTVSREINAIRGQVPCYLVAELDWDDIGSLREDFESEVGLHAGRDAETLADLCPGMYSMTFEVTTI
jgi:uncharacterized protein (TIGR02118 family)